MKNKTCLILIVFLLAGCSQKGKGESTSSTESSSSFESSMNSNSETSNEESSETSSEESSSNSSSSENETPLDDKDINADVNSIPLKETPRIDITTNDGTAITSKEEYKASKISISNCEDEYLLSDIDAGVRLRGNSTYYAPKKPYRIKFEKKINMLGLNDGNKFKSWVLLADYYDGTMMRNYSAFSLAKTLFDGYQYSSDFKHVEVYVNGDYQGFYLLAEQTQINKNRINIDEKNEDDGETLETGYLFSGVGGQTDEDYLITINFNTNIIDRNGNSSYYSSANFALSGDGWSNKQMSFIQNYTSNAISVIQNAIYQKQYYSLGRDGTISEKVFTDDSLSEKEKQYETIDAVFDIKSCISMTILEELAKNLDPFSFNFYVDLSENGNGKITLCAPWDYDFSFGNMKYDEGRKTEDYYATKIVYTDGMRNNYFHMVMGSLGWYNDLLKQTWKEKYHDILDTVEDITFEAFGCQNQINKDYYKWNLPAKRNLIGHHSTKDLNYMFNASDSAYFLIDWINSRISWINGQWGDDFNHQYNLKSLSMDMSNERNKKYIYAPNDISYSLTDSGMAIDVTKAYDPYFYINYEEMPTKFSFEDYSILEIEYKIDVENLNGDKYLGLFICANENHGATTQSYTTINYEKNHEWTTSKIDLTQIPNTSGQANKIRFDIFEASSLSDKIIIKEIKLLRK